MAVGKLTAKQARFVEEYLVDLNATQAATRAGYSPKTAGVLGYENLNKPQIAEAIQAAQKARSRRTEITQDRVLREYAKIAFADIKDFLSYRTEKTVVDREDGEPVFGYRQVVEMVPSDGVDGTQINEVSINEKGVLAFKLHDKKSALDMIGRHLGMFKDVTKHEGEIGVRIVDDIPKD